MQHAYRRAPCSLCLRWFDCNCAAFVACFCGFWGILSGKPALAMRRFGVCLACLHACALALQFRTQDAALAHRAAISSRPHGITTLGSNLMPNPRRSCGVSVCVAHGHMTVVWRFNFTRKMPRWRIGRLNHRVRTAQQLLAANSYRTSAGHAAFRCVPRMFACLCFDASIPHARRRAGATSGYIIASTRHSSSWQQTHAKPVRVMQRFGVCRACLHACAFALQFRTQDATQAHQAAIPSRPHDTTTLGSYLMPNPRRPCGQHTHALNALMPKQTPRRRNRESAPARPRGSISPYFAQPPLRHASCRSVRVGRDNTRLACLCVCGAIIYRRGPIAITRPCGCGAAALSGSDWWCARGRAAALSWRLSRRVSTRAAGRSSSPARAPG